jgi:hypothetical protein
MLSGAFAQQAPWGRADVPISSHDRVYAADQTSNTGPRSVEGKKTSSHNATKHGLLINDVVITTRANKEDQTEFDALLDELRDYYNPIGVAEDLLVQELAVSYWKSARALRCERADITCAGTAQPQAELGELEVTVLMAQPPADAYHWLLERSRGIKFLLRKVEQARNEVELSDRVSKELHWWLTPKQDWGRIAASGKKPLLAALEKEIEELTAQKNQVEKDEAEWANDRRDCSAIPSKEVLDRINRYETSNVRHRYRVEARLERLQGQRRENRKLNSEKDSDAEDSQDPQFCETKPNGRASDERAPQGVGLPKQGPDEVVSPPIKVEIAEEG